MKKTTRSKAVITIVLADAEHLVRKGLQLTAQGDSRADIARRLGISARTSEAHRAHAQAKLGLRNRVDVIRYALARGILATPGGPEPASPKRQEHRETA